MSKPPRSFFAYPGAPAELRSTIETAHEWANLGSKGKIWPQLDIFGAFIPDEIRQAIDDSEIAFFDVTIQNRNVYYELGYAIGRGKAVGPVINNSFDHTIDRIQREGIFDNIGYQQYVNANGLKKILLNHPNHVLVQLYAKDINFRQPLYVLDTELKTDFRNSIVSEIKRSGFFYRSFDPIETPRISTVQLIGDISSSSGVIIPILGQHIVGHQQHNLRGAFAAGLANGLDRPTLLIKLRENDDDMQPADFRDQIRIVRDDKDIKALVGEFAVDSVVAAQAIDVKSQSSSSNALTSITLGAVAAENEFRTLGQYFIETSEYTRTVRGDVKVVTGRKGSGKSAIFFQARDALRKNQDNIVVDLKPESYQLVEFREELRKIESGIFTHTITAFWHSGILFFYQR